MSKYTTESWQMFLDRCHKRALDCAHSAVKSDVTCADDDRLDRILTIVCKKRGGEGFFRLRLLCSEEIRFLIRWVNEIRGSRREIGTSLIIKDRSELWK